MHINVICRRQAGSNPCGQKCEESSTCIINVSLSITKKDEEIFSKAADEFDWLFVLSHYPGIVSVRLISLILVVFSV